METQLDEANRLMADKQALVEKITKTKGVLDILSNFKDVIGGVSTIQSDILTTQAHTWIDSPCCSSSNGSA